MKIKTKIKSGAHARRGYGISKQIHRTKISI